MQPAALPAPDNPGTWDDLTQPNTTARPRLPFPAAPIIGLPDSHLKDASGAAMRPGSARSLTCPPARHKHRQLPGKQETPITHALAQPLQAENTRSNHLDTAPLLQG